MTQSEALTKDHEWGLVSRDGRTNVKKEARGNWKEKAACGQKEAYSGSAGWSQEPRLSTLH